MEISVDGSTKVCGLFGDPVEHSLSPAMHNAAFKAMGLNYIYVPFRVKPEKLREAVRAVKALGLVGVNITVPHKETILPHLDRVSREARLVGAVNTVVNRGGVLEGYNTDGSGFIAALREEIGFDPAGKVAVVLGAGGAARAVVVHLVLAGADLVGVANRSHGRARSLAGEVAARTGSRVEAVPWPEKGDGAFQKLVMNADLIVQATPVGMYPKVEECLPFPFELLRSGQVVCDLVYNPPQTAFLKRAKDRGAVAINGLGMLIHQGAQAFQIWTGRTPPVELMREVLRKSLYG